MNSKPYLVSFQLWNIASGEAHGDLLRESGEFEISGLNTLDDELAKFCATHGSKFLGDVVPESLSIDGMRVSMSRNAGQGILRSRIEVGTQKLYRIDTRARRVEELNILQFIYNSFTVMGSKASVEMTPDTAGSYWVKVYWRGNKARCVQSVIKGQHPLTGRQATATLHSEPTSNEAIYFLED